MNSTHRTTVYSKCQERWKKGGSATTNNREKRHGVHRRRQNRGFCRLNTRCVPIDQKSDSDEDWEVESKRTTTIYSRWTIKIRWRTIKPASSTKIRKIFHHQEVWKVQGWDAIFNKTFKESDEQNNSSTDHHHKRSTEARVFSIFLENTLASVLCLWWWSVLLLFCSSDSLNVLLKMASHPCTFHCWLLAPNLLFVLFYYCSRHIWLNAFISPKVFKSLLCGYFLG